MTCPACGSANEAGRKFCGECGTRLAAVCQACGTANAAGARFCGECGTPLVGSAAPVAPSTVPAPAAQGASAPAGAAPASPAPVAERRLVSVLFADLVGFTTLSEGRDPEAVRELLSTYFDLAAETIRRYGGTVEKFIGDAVMAVWGAPTAHEDDAERAVRAALEILDVVTTLGPGIQARGGVLTGEAAVTLGARDQGMVAGDLVNTASRLQSVAPAGSVLVGPTTHQATLGSIAYEAAGEQVLKGKVAPVEAWRALRVVAERRGRGRDERLEAPFVGREPELRLMKDLFHATARERRVRLVSVTGQAGIGKSRLAWEFLKYVDGVVQQVWWHEGRSPSYGEGITFWALGEMVRSRAGLLETDDEATTRARIAEAVSRYVPDEAERRRIEPALLTLLGIGEAPAGGGQELFAAWRTFFERVASSGVTALLFEDLHWADPGTLDFIEHMLEWSRNVPILIITLARPELLETRPGWGAGKRSFLALDLQPLDESSMRQLLAGLVPGLPEQAARSIVARAEGIPLYAVETIRMLVADGRLRDAGEGVFEPVGELGELAVPSTLRALIAARLDALEPGDRSLIQDAAVLGQSFSSDALAAVAGIEPAELDRRLTGLVRSDLLHVEVDPRSPERGQYAFVQALIREVAYSTLALRDRRARHLAAARHFESIGDDELAGALAAHYVAAYKASAEGPEADALRAQARLALKAAAARAEQLGALVQAVAFLDQALEVALDDADRAEILEQAGLAATRASRSDLAVEILGEAVRLREQLGDPGAIARATYLQGNALAAGRRREEAQQVFEAAIERLGDLGDDPRWVELLAAYGKVLALTGDYPRAHAISSDALARAERLQLAPIAAECLFTLGSSAMFQGRLWEARSLMRGARDVAEQAATDPDFGIRVGMQLAAITALDDPAEAVALQRDIIVRARRIGRSATVVNTVGNMAEDARRSGDWDLVLAEVAETMQQELDPAGIVVLDASRAGLELLRGGAGSEMVADIERRLEGLEDRDVEAGKYDLWGLEAFARSDYAGASAQWRQGLPMSDYNAPYILPRIGVVSILAGDAGGAREALAALAATGARGRAIDADRATIEAGIAGLSGDREAAIAGYRAGAAAFRDLSLDWDEALLALQAASVLGPRMPEVDAWIDRGREVLQRLGATPILDQLERLAIGESAAARAAGDGPVREPAAEQA
jgi:class 3 adenylate cyclase/tetratricopeptide (TPR) repeat protein